MKLDVKYEKTLTKEIWIKNSTVEVNSHCSRLLTILNSCNLLVASLLIKPFTCLPINVSTIWFTFISKNGQITKEKEVWFTINTEENISNRITNCSHQAMDKLRLKGCTTAIICCQNHLLSRKTAIHVATAQLPHWVSHNSICLNSNCLQYIHQTHLQQRSCQTMQCVSLHK